MTGDDRGEQLPAVFAGADADPDEAPPSRRRRRPLRASLAGLTVAVVAAAAVLAATGAFGGDGGGSPSSAPSGPPRTAKVERTTLTRTQTVDGNLGYGTATAVQAPAAGGSSDPGTSGGKGGGGQPTQGSGSGVITWLPGAGDVISRGRTVYSIDEQKVPLLYGSTPFYRTLDVGAEGNDVETLEKNLSALGYTGFTVDDEYTSGTAAAVKDWQDDLGRDQTGTVGPGDAVVASGARRVDDVKATRGSTPAGSILTWTGTERIVSVDLDVQYEDLVNDGTAATVKLPDGTEVDAKVSDVGTAATAPPSSSGSSSGGSSPGGSGGSAPDATLPVKLSVRDQRKLGRYQAAPVDVTLKAETRRNVLAVPINALVALREGGYAVETVGTKGIEYLPVKLGMFAGGLVEVSGDGITKGLVVGVPE